MCFVINECYLCFGGIVFGLIMFVIVDVCVYVVVLGYVGFKVLVVMINFNINFMCKFELGVLIGWMWLFKLGK